MIARAPFGRTGHESTRMIFGGAALYEGSPEKADRCLDLLLQFDINHIDTAADYGESEKWIGRWMGSHRSRFFLATKTSARDRKGAMASLKRSLDLLRVEQVDLMQIHCLIDSDEWDTAFGPEGALEALLEAGEQGLTRFIGVPHMTSLRPPCSSRAWRPTALIPSWCRTTSPWCSYRSTLPPSRSCSRFAMIKVSLCKRSSRSRAVRRARMETATQRGTSLSVRRRTSTEQSIGSFLGRKGVFLNSVADVELLPKVLDAASRHYQGIRPTDAEMNALSASRQMQRIFPIENEEK